MGDTCSSCSDAGGHRDSGDMDEVGPDYKTESYAGRSHSKRSRGSSEISDPKFDSWKREVWENKLKHGSIAEVEDYVRANPSCLEQFLSNDFRAIHHAVAHEDVDLLKRLYKLGADMNAVTRKGDSALHLAVMLDSVDMCKWLCRCRKVDVLQKDANNQAAMDLTDDSTLKKIIINRINHQRKHIGEAGSTKRLQLKDSDSLSISESDPTGNRKEWLVSVPSGSHSTYTTKESRISKHEAGAAVETTMARESRGSFDDASPKAGERGDDVIIMVSQTSSSKIEVEDSVIDAQNSPLGLVTPSPDLTFSPSPPLPITQDLIEEPTSPTDLPLHIQHSASFSPPTGTVDSGTSERSPPTASDSGYRGSVKSRSSSALSFSEGSMSPTSMSEIEILMGGIKIHYLSKILRKSDAEREKIWNKQTVKTDGMLTVKSFTQMLYFLMAVVHRKKGTERPTKIHTTSTFKASLMRFVRITQGDIEHPGLESTREWRVSFDEFNTHFQKWFDEWRNVELADSQSDNH